MQSIDSTLPPLRVEGNVQEFWIDGPDGTEKVILPPAEAEVIPGVSWGRGEMLDTPAYWMLRCRIASDPLDDFVSDGGDLVEEIGFCLLGGFGVTAELNSAAFVRLRDAGVFDLTRSFDENSIRQLLLEPLRVFDRPHRYRFPNQRAKRLGLMRDQLRHVDLNELTEQSMRELLLTMNGIGPKTAAWVIRNHFNSDKVAIIDIHLIRACQRINVFPEAFRLPQDYEPLEQRFLDFAQALDVRPAILDAIIWTEMRQGTTSRRSDLAASRPTH